ncbi:MAG TPA: ABC transporter substrate-binding protein, partial [Thermomicrobiales bacterium]|nr:ABC transporter substrate-binding protein [Thermomicrobiales bacterium]
LEPDLIICMGEDDEWFPARKLQRFAPVVPTTYQAYWKDDLKQVAGWLQRTSDLDAGMVAYDKLISDGVAHYGDLIASKKVVYLQYLPDTTNFALNTTGMLQAQILTDLGGTLFGGLLGNSDGDFISLERIGEFAEADGFFVQDLSGSGALDALAELPLWTSLPAVKAGHVVASRGNVNYGSIYTAQELARNWTALYATMA